MGREQMYRSKTFKKMLVSISLVCLCFYGIGLFSNEYNRKVLSKQIHDTLDSRVHFFGEQLKQEADSLLLTQSSLMDDSNLFKLHVMWDSLSYYQRNEAIKQYANRLLNVKILHDTAASIQTFFPKRKVVISADSPILDDYTEDEYGFFQQSYLDENGNICLTIYFPYNVKQNSGTTPSLYIRSVLTPKTLHDKLKEMLGEEEGTIYLMDQEGGVLAYSGNNLSENTEHTSLLEAVRKEIEKNETEQMIHASHNGFASGCFLQGLDIWLVYCFPDQIVEEPLAFFHLFNIVLTLLVVALLGAYSFYARKAFARPLGRILQAMEDVQDKESFLIQEKGIDELDLIYDKYNKMVIRTENLIRENLDSKYRVHIAQLSALSYQIQPHFLYNSLFLIYRMAQMDENEVIAEYAEHLGKYYQYITRVSDSKVEISQEIDHIRNYLAIQEARFGGRIHSYMEPVPEELEGMAIMPLTLQPLVENAYEHGMKDRIRNGEVNIRMRHEGNFFCFTVEDNGPGMSSQEEEREKKRMQEGRLETGQIHALSNTNIRLKLAYGEESGLVFGNRQEGGFRVTARIRIEGETDV